MTFVVNAIKQDNKQKQTLQFLLDIDSSLLARQILEKSGLVLLSLKEYTQIPSAFGPLYIKFFYENQSITVVGEKDMTLKNLCLLFLGFGFAIEDLNYFKEPQSSDQIKKVIEICKNEMIQQHKNQQTASQKVKEAERKIYYSNEGLEKAKTVISWVIGKVTLLLQEKGAFISSKDLRTIKNMIEELKKLRMGTNYEKIRDMLQDLFSLVDRIEEGYYASIEDTSLALFPGTKVTSLDVEKQLAVLEKVRQQEVFGGNISTQRKDYAVFGELFIYLFFLKKDVLGSWSPSLLKFFYNIFELLALGTMMILFFLSLFLLANQLLSLGYSPNPIYSAFVSLGLLGGVFYAASFFKKNMLSRNILLLFLCVIFYWIFLPILNHSFALG